MIFLGSCKALLLNNKERETSRENQEKQKKLEEHRKLMQPTYKKYGFRKKQEEVTPLHNHEERFYANAGRVGSCNMSESGGGQIRSLSRGDKSSSNSPIRNEILNTIDPKEMRPIFNTITEVCL